MVNLISVLAARQVTTPRTVGIEARSAAAEKSRASQTSVACLHSNHLLRPIRLYTRLPNAQYRTREYLTEREEWDAVRPSTDRHRTSRRAPSPAGTKTRTICLHERARRSDVRSCLSPDGDAAWAGRQDAVWNPPPHVAAFHW